MLVLKMPADIWEKIGVTPHYDCPAERVQNLVAEDSLLWGETDSTSAHEQRDPNLHNFERGEAESRARAWCSRSWGWQGMAMTAQQGTRACCTEPPWAAGGSPEATLGEKQAGKPRMGCTVLLSPERPGFFHF